MAPVLSHSRPDAPVPSVSARRVDAPLEVDGRLNEPFWADTPIGSNFIDTRTHKPADQQTRVRLAYTREFLYIAVECLDDQPEKIRAVERREDREFTADDWVEVHLDPTHSHQSKYAFFANPLGTRADANEGPSGVFNRGWSANWDCAAALTTNGWTFEMRIPFSILNYERRNGQTWGLNFTRALRHTDTTSFWSYNPTDEYKPRNFGHLTGLDLADSVFDRNWEIRFYYFKTLKNISHFLP
ncbi:MAG TPA: carbohydrate binding family 9 domain-containing protein, partial [Candidatus Paceibacterota bacterium]|nr:carbohydrate binding family 9 domain-containing protein [Verrucomicrobiota bacterium]HSA02603.1 carbohydrate binding family 9 domain-containing protein [Candidatus Paceibacterota bacterium]